MLKQHDVGFLHMDVKHLLKLRDVDGSAGKRYSYVGIDRASRFDGRVRREARGIADDRHQDLEILLLGFKLVH